MVTPSFGEFSCARVPHLALCGAQRLRQQVEDGLWHKAVGRAAAHGSLCCRMVPAHSESGLARVAVAQ